VEKKETNKKGFLRIPLFSVEDKNCQFLVIL